MGKIEGNEQNKVGRKIHLLVLSLTQREREDQELIEGRLVSGVEGRERDVYN
jgi:hypothetical protein